MSDRSPNEYRITLESVCSVIEEIHSLIPESSNVMEYPSGIHLTTAEVLQDVPDAPVEYIDRLLLSSRRGDV